MCNERCRKLLESLLKQAEELARELARIEGNAA